MAGAAERAKLDEWEERGVDVSNAVKVPVHPRCRCSTTVKDDGNGNFTAVFAPAPDACPWCLSLQEGDKGR
jgi:sugar/nucleoside kinase (ribokinase family)